MLNSESQAFKMAVEEVLSCCVGCEVSLIESTASNREKPNHEIRGIIGISGAICGTAALSVSRDFACKATGALLGDSPADLNSDVVDALGEIVNMIAGRARVLLGNEATNMSLPSVIIGRCEIAFGSDTSDTVLDFESSWGPISMELAMKQTMSAAPVANVTPVAALV